MSDRCQWTFEDETAYFIHGCIGGAVGGPEGCTYGHPLSEIERERDARLEAEEYVEVLQLKAQRRHEFVDSIMRDNKRLSDEVRQLTSRQEAGE